MCRAPPGSVLGLIFFHLHILLDDKFSLRTLSASHCLDFKMSISSPELQIMIFHYQTANSTFLFEYLTSFNWRKKLAPTTGLLKAHEACFSLPLGPYTIVNLLESLCTELNLSLTSISMSSTLLCGSAEYSLFDILDIALFLLLRI